MSEGNEKQTSFYSDNSNLKSEVDSFYEKHANNLEVNFEFYEIISDYEKELNRLRTKLAETEAKLEKALEASYVDPLTDCLNQNFYENIFKADNFDPRYDRNELALVYIDLNGLKEINDTPKELGGGHQAGDQLIKDTADFLRAEFRRDDVVVRLHGDEFVVICRDRKDGIREDVLLNRVTDIRDKAADRNPALSFAAGVAVFDDVIHEDRIDSSLEDTEVRAEQMMYAVKKEMKQKR